MTNLINFVIKMANKDLSRANLSGANLSEANLSEANLSEANLSEADLSEADLSEADLSEADLSRADLFGANLSRADLFGANLSRADLFGANGIVAIQFSGFSVYVQRQKTKIGCMYKTHDEWMAVTENEAIEFGIKAEHFEIYRDAIKFGLRVLEVDK